MVAKSGLLGLCAMWMGHFFSMFRRNGHCFRRQAYESTDGHTTHNTPLQRTFHTTTADISHHYGGHFTALRRTFHTTTADISQPPSRKSRRFSVLNVLTPKIKCYCNFYPILPQFKNLHVATFTILAPKPSNLISVLCTHCIQTSPQQPIKILRSYHLLRGRSLKSLTFSLLCAASLMTICGGNMQLTS